MVTRRQTLFGLVSAAAGGAAVTAGAFTSSVESDADMRVVVVSDLRLEPAREGREYVETDDEGLIEQIVIDELNRNARSVFADLVEVINNGDTSHDELCFRFEGDGAETLEITSEVDVTEDDGVFELSLDDELEPGDGVVFGLVIDLISAAADVSEGVEIELEITTDCEE